MSTYHFTTKTIRDANAAAGFRFFERGTMRFFSARVLSGVYGGKYFVTSERDTYRDENPRLYSVRSIREDGSIETHGGFQAFDSARKARAHAVRLAREEREV